MIPTYPSVHVHLSLPIESSSAEITVATKMRKLHTDGCHYFSTIIRRVQFDSRENVQNAMTSTMNLFNLDVYAFLTLGSIHTGVTDQMGAPVFEKDFRSDETEEERIKKIINPLKG